MIDMGVTTIGTLLAGLGVGAAAGAHTATWGMYKDAPHEGFTWRKYARSIALGSLLGRRRRPRSAGLDATRAAGAVVLFGLVYALERALVEFYKTFVREEDQSKYTIPMQFAVFGKPVQGRARRWTVAAGVAAVALLLAFWTANLDAASLPLPILLLIGSAAGWVSAFGGAWKDAPIEGFETFKFFRSPAITGTYAFLISRLDGRDADRRSLRARLHGRHDRDLQDVLLPEQAAREVREQADRLPRVASLPPEVRPSVRRDLALRDRRFRAGIALRRPSHGRRHARAAHGRAFAPPGRARSRRRGLSARPSGRGAEA